MTNIDDIINILKKYTTSEIPKEFQEQDTAGGGGGSSSGGGGAKYPTVTKWETGIKRGAANPAGKLGKWKDVYSTNRGKANTLL